MLKKVLVFVLLFSAKAFSACPGGVCTVTDWDTFKTAVNTTSVDGDTISINATSIAASAGAINGDINFNKNLTLQLASGIASCTILTEDDRMIQINGQAAGATVTWHGPITIDQTAQTSADDSDTTFALRCITNGGNLTVTLNNIHTIGGGYDPGGTGTNGGGFHFACTTAHDVIAVANNCSASGSWNDGFSTESSAAGTVTFTMNGCSTDGTHQDEGVSPHNSNNNAAADMLININGGSFQDRFSPGSTPMIYNITGAVLDLDHISPNTGNTPPFLAPASSVAAGTLTVTDCTIRDARPASASVFGSQLDSGNRASLIVRRCNVTIGANSRLFGGTGEAGIAGDFEMWDSTVSFEAGHIGTVDARLVETVTSTNFALRRCIINGTNLFSGNSATNRYGIYTQVGCETDVEGCLFYGWSTPTGKASWWIYNVGVTSTNSRLINTTINGDNITDAGSTNGIAFFTGAIDFDVYGNIFYDLNHAIYDTIDADDPGSYTQNSDNDYNTFDPNVTNNVYNTVDRGGGLGAGQVAINYGVQSNDQELAPGFVDEPNNDYRISASGGAELYVATSAYQLEAYPFHIVGNHTTFDLSPDFWGWNNTNTRYTGTPDREPLEAGSSLINGGAYNYNSSLRSVVWTANRKWTVYGGQWTGRRR